MHASTEDHIEDLTCANLNRSEANSVLHPHFYLAFWFSTWRNASGCWSFRPFMV